MSERTKVALILGTLVLYWGQLWNQLRLEWSANAQYNYGWFVPVLAAGLFWRRWLERPAPAPRGAPRGWGEVVCVAGLLLALFPVRLLHEANVGWRAMQWAHAGVLTVLSLWVLWHLGGPRWLRHFAFPVGFLLVAVPWPSRFEDALVQGLMRAVAAATVGVLDVLNVPALRHGAVIEVGSGLVGVDEACSGVRSLQTSLMLGLLMGELYGHRPWRRVALLGAAVVIALSANLGRTTFLTWEAARHGLGSLDVWHSPAGVAVVVTELLLLWAVAAGWAGLAAPRSVAPALEPIRDRHPGSSAPPDGGGELSAAAALGSGVRGQREGFESSNRPAAGGLARLPGSWVLVGLAWLGSLEAGTELWYRLGERQMTLNPRWSVRWPAEAPAYKEQTPSDKVHATLRYDAGRSVVWEDAAGNQWHAAELDWDARNQHAFIARGHTPDLCLAGAGWVLRAEPTPVRFTVQGIELPWRRYVFEAGGRSAYVFLSLWEMRSVAGRQPGPLAYLWRARVAAAWQARRHQGLRKLEIAVVGPPNPEAALALFERQLQALIVPAG